MHMQVAQEVSGLASERRQYGRVELDEPLQGSLEGMPVQVVEVSVTGMRLAHESRLPPAATRRLTVTGGAAPMEFSCSVIRSMLHRLARNPGEKTIYHSGVQIIEAYGDSDLAVRNLIAERVIRALEEQKANARGIPPITDFTYQIEKGDRFRRCELVNGVWRKFDTTNPQQPENGFTIAAAVAPFHVDMLCRTYEQTTAEGRRLTQILAQLSISRKEGTRVRRYLP
jgi:hypothetical protein